MESNEHPSLAATSAASIITCLVLGSCTTLPQQPLSVLGPSKIGPVSCQFESGSETSPTYSSDSANLAGPNLADGLVVALIEKGIKEAAEAPGQTDLNRISKGSGSAENQMILENLRKELTAAGYTVRKDAPSTFSVKATHYGMHKNFNGNSFPKIIGNGILRDSAGNVIWTGAEVTAWYNANKSFKDYTATPSLYRSDFNETAQAFAKQAVNCTGAFSISKSPQNNGN